MSYARAGFGRRMLAAAADAVISLVLALLPLVGGAAAAAYMLLRDALAGGRSPGKRLANLSVVRVPAFERATLIDSIRRNAIFVAPDMLVLVPIVGAALAAPVSIAVFILEIVFMVTDPDGLRLGDRFAGTMVVEILPGRLRAA